MTAPDLSPEEAVRVAVSGIHPESRKPLIMNDQLVTVEVSKDVNQVIWTWLDQHLEDLELVLSEFGLVPMDIVRPTFLQLVYLP